MKGSFPFSFSFTTTDSLDQNLVFVKGLQLSEPVVVLHSRTKLSSEFDELNFHDSMTKHACCLEQLTSHIAVLTCQLVTFQLESSNKFTVLIESSDAVGDAAPVEPS